MIQWRFYLDDVEYDEPDNFADLVLMLKRDERYHGVFFEASISSLTFSGAAADYIIEQDDLKGLLALIVFRAEFRCAEADPWDELVKGTLNMGKLERDCGSGCRVIIPIEQTNCTMLVRNRFDQRVDLDSLVAFDKVTALGEYEYAGFNMTMLAKAIPVGTVGHVVTAKDRVMFDTLPNAGGGAVNLALTLVRPTYGEVNNESLKTSELVPTVWIAGAESFVDHILSPVLLLSELIDCFAGAFSYTFRFKGHFFINDALRIRLRMIKGVFPEGNDSALWWDPNDVPPAPLTVIIDEEIGTWSQDDLDENFDFTRSGTFTLEQGEGVWLYLYVLQFQRIESAGAYIEFDPETSVSITAIRECPTTDAKVYMINEALSRVTEAVTNACLRVRSDYYGRTDSQPYASAEDGCGGLRAINNGLQLRRADVRDPQSDDFAEAKMFLSLKDAFEGLAPIDNIGFGIEPDPGRTGFDQLRIEPVNYWYREEEILSLPLPREVQVITQEQEAFASVKTGYKKWEVEAVNGLDEVNANREFRTALTTVNNTLDIQSSMVAGSYAIEITRQQSYAETGAADTTYDNETFIYCVKRALYGFDVELGNIQGGTGMFSPATLYNWRIRPFYNLMRWFKSIASAYPNVGDSEKKLFFAAGTGNYRAAGELAELGECKLENGVKAENQDLGKDDFVGGDFQPLWRPKSIQFKYPVSLGEYRNLKASPYGYISVQCGTGEWLKGFINTVQYSPAKGEAEFNLRMKWQA